MPDRDDPARYLREHAHHTEDLPLWRSVAREVGGPVLDLGCAAGRVAVPLLEDGLEVWALDADAGMLAEVEARAAALGPAAAARLHTVRGDLRDFALGGTVRLAIAAMNTLQVLLTPEDQLACLLRVREHLDAGDGELWFDVALPDLADVAGALGVVRAEGVHREDDGTALWHSSWFEDLDPLTQTVSFVRRVEEVSPGGAPRAFHRRHVVHLFQPAELEHLLARAGLRVLDRWGDFAGGDLEAGSVQQVYRCGVA
jgi:SAM-dependent methyltransferase